MATLFFHFWFIPLIPLQTFVVLKEEESISRRTVTFEGVPIGFSGKSILLGYGRAAAVITALVTGMQVLGGVLGPPQVRMSRADLVVSGILLIAAVAFVFLSRVLPSMAKANCDRALWLAHEANLPATTVDAVRRVYGLRGGYSDIHGIPVAEPYEASGTAPGDADPEQGSGLSA